MQREALELGHAWGFGQPKTELVWRKITKTGKEHFGMGRTLRASHETCLVFRRGKSAPENLSVRSVFAGYVRAHSQKPNEFYDIVEKLYPSARKIEMFARTVRPGWEQYGNQLGSIALTEAK